MLSKVNSTSLNFANAFSPTAVTMVVIISNDKRHYMLMFYDYKIINFNINKRHEKKKLKINTTSIITLKNSFRSVDINNLISLD